MTLTTKALVASLLLLAVPFAAIPWINDYERMLVDTQRDAMAWKAATAAAHLADHPLIAAATRVASAHGGEPLYAHRLDTWVEVDGHIADFGMAAAQSRNFSTADTLQVNVPYDPASLSADVVIGTDGRHLFLHAQVHDDRVVYREIGSLSVHRNDYFQFASVDANGDYRRYTIAPQQPGPADVYRIASYQQGSRALRIDEQIEAYWRATDDGYNVEVRVPLELVSHQFAFSVTDVDNADTRAPRYSLGSASTTFEEDIGHIVLPDPALDELLGSINPPHSRLVLHNRNLRTLAETGSIEQAEGIWANRQGAVIPLPFYLSTDNMAVMSAAHPILVDGVEQGAVVVEENSRGMRRTLNRFIQSVTLFSVVFIVAGTLLASGVGFRLSHRIAALRAQLAGSVDPQGRVTRPMPQPTGHDELSELTNTFRQITDRLHQYNRYLENLSRRLSHELRTPVSVVSSSLDNLSMATDDDNRDVYIERAREGVQRLSRILSSMSEATRLETSLNADELEYFDLAAVVQGCVQGYELAWPEQSFELDIEDEFDKVLGLPELINQLMDKLVGNAVEFASPGTPIRVRLTREPGPGGDDEAVVRIINEGPALPASGDHLFDSMISIREGEQAEGTHLGLGLYIARLIAEFHGGSIALDNRMDTSGVIATVRLPILRIKGDKP